METAKVLCPSCSQENRDNARFCKTCGAALARACASCGAKLGPDAAFCDSCGQRIAAPGEAEPTSPRAYTPAHLAEKILRDRATLQGERRAVTVLFADAKGFTPLTERIGDEEVYTLIQGCTSRMMDAVHRYEGTVTQFTGDGIIALFGAPIAHEDSARRAVAAALEMQRSLVDYTDDVKKRHPIECRFRVGLNTGPVVVGRVSDNLDMDYTAIGDTVNLASRMEQLAAPGSVYLTENTYRAVRDYFDCESLGEMDVKGKSEPVAVYRAVSARSVSTRLEAAVERGLTPFVGRSHELSLLQSYLEHARGGEGQVIFVSGEAGIGKSRLLLEFRRSVPDDVRWLEGHCISFGRNIPYLPIIDVLKRAFAVQEGDDDACILKRIEDGTAGWSDAASATVPYIKYLLNVDPGRSDVLTMDPRERRAGILDGLRALFQEETRAGPLVALIEDLHWIDERSEEALSILVEAIARVPVLLVLTYRPGYAHSLGERTYYSRVAVSRLPEEASAAIAGAVLQTAQLPRELQQLITGKAEGNPFYVEEVTKSLIDSGALRKSNGSYALARPVDQISVPDTIQEVILSRIDRLESQAREAIQLASVIGREFTVRLLERITNVETHVDSLLGDLKSLELIYEKSYFPELSYMFKHALTHEVALSTLLAERRKALHRIVAAAVEELYADRLPEHYEMLAHHYYEGEAWEKALDYLEKAGDKAAAAFANQEALDYYARARDVAKSLGETGLRPRASVSVRRGFLNYALGDFPGATADLDDVRVAAQTLGDREAEARALAYRGLSELQAHDFDRSERTLAEAVALAGDTLPEIRFLANAVLASQMTVLNAGPPVDRLFEELALAAGGVRDPMARAWWALFDGARKNWRGDFDEALATHLGSRPDVARTNVSPLTVMNLWLETLSCAGKGEYTRALAVADHAVATCERVGEISGYARVLNTIGWIRCELQDHPRAMEYNRQSLAVAAGIKALSKIEVEANARLNLADGLIALGQLDEAEEHTSAIEQVVRHPKPAERWMLWRYSQHLFHTYGELWLARGDAKKALRYAAECLEIAEPGGYKKNVVKGRRLRGQAHLAQGKLTEAETDIAGALAIARPLGNPPQLWKTLVALGDLRSAQGRPDEAKAAHREALAVIEGVAAELEDATLRETFLGSDHVRQIREKAG